MILPFGIMLSYSSHYFSSCHFQVLFCFESVSCLGASKNLSLGMSEPRHTLEVIHYIHIGALGKAIEYHGIWDTSHFHLFQLSFPKV